MPLWRSASLQLDSTSAFLQNLFTKFNNLKVLEERFSTTPLDNDSLKWLAVLQSENLRHTSPFSKFLDHLLFPSGHVSMPAPLG